MAIRAIDLFRKPSANNSLDKVRRNLLAAELMQKEASRTDQPVYSHGHGLAKLGTALLGNVVEGREDAKVQGWQGDLAKALGDYTGGGGSPGSRADAGPLPDAVAEKIPDDILDRKKKAYIGLVDRGLSPVAAAGVVGNLRAESNLDPTNATGDNGTAFGLAQWRGPRFAALQQMAAQQGKDWRDPSVQLDHLVSELKGT
jgi:hypothetical protein